MSNGWNESRVEVNTEGVEDLDEVDWESALEAITRLLAPYSELDGHSIIFLIESELEVQEGLLEMGLEKTVLVRQSTFIESFLSSLLQIEIEERLSRDLSSSDENYLQQGISPKGKVRLAFWFEILEKEERDALLDLMGVRGEIAHTAWSEIETTEKYDEDNYERIVNRIYDLLQEFEEQLSST